MKKDQLTEHSLMIQWKPLIQTPRGHAKIGCKQENANVGLVLGPQGRSRLAPNNRRAMRITTPFELTFIKKPFEKIREK